jgi:hypothetical protein
MPNQTIANYTGYQGLPPLAGLTTMAAILGPDGTQAHGLTVAESVDRLKRLHWAMRRLHAILVAHIAAQPIYELKMAFSLHALYLADHAGAFAQRVREMRQPPYGLDNSPDPALDLYFDEILSAPTTEALVLGLYGAAIPAVLEAIQRFEVDTNRLFDHPTYRVLRFALPELEEVQTYGAQAIHSLVDEPTRTSLQPWIDQIQLMLAAAGSLDGTAPRTGADVPRHYSAKPFVYDPIPQRDQRFQDPYNMGVNAEAMLFDNAIPPHPKTLMLFFKRMREIDVPEVMASILVETTGKPWEYTRAMTRQMWDEARHAMMGEIGFIAAGIDWRQIPFNFTWSRGLNTILTPLERHGVLYTIEQGLMPKKTGKMREWEIAVASDSRLSELIQDYDWADEIVHAKIGRDWLVPELGSQQKAIAFGDEAWSRTLVDWAKWRDQGLTQHRNWWPEIYTQACAHAHIDPDPAILAYNTTYENIRADMKQVTG